MTNEQYLIVSYFSAAAAGVLAAVATALLLRRPLREAVARFAVPVRRFMTRSLFAWFVLAALLVFMSVGYFGTCDHKTYQSVVEDMPWMISKTRFQIQRVSAVLFVAVLTYAMSMAVVLIIPRRKG
ncbi:MAG: hypothetical protein LLG01_08840 [Planctomycetaceae bacterium]|nr:hypothetical protein [Planctomycetaceae bacterium]